MQCAKHYGKSATDSGFTLSDVIITCAVAVTIMAIAAPQLLGFREAARGAAAARYVANRLHLTRMEALKRSAHAAVAFFGVGTELEYAVYLDGNGNGVRTSEIASGTDRMLSPRERLEHLFPGAAFGIVDGTPSIDGSGPLAGGDPIRVGRSELVSFSPLGGATPGTLYVTGPGQRQWAIRVTGATGRVNVFAYDVAAQRWQAR